MTDGSSPEVRTTEPAPGTRRNDSSSVRRAVRITGVLAERAGKTGLSLTELATALAMNKSTVLRLLQPLIDARLVARDETGNYRLGVQALVLGQAYLHGLDLRDAARAQLHELATASGETVHLVIYDRPDVVYIDKVDSPNTVRMFSHVGARMPAYCTAVGKTLLADADEDELQAVFAAGLPGRTEHTITSEPHLRQELAHVAGAGYAIDDEENEVDIRCIAAPIVDATGRTVSALSVSGPAGRMTPEKVDQLVPVVTSAAWRVSERLGAGAAPASRPLLTVESQERNTSP